MIYNYNKLFGFTLDSKFNPSSFCLSEQLKKYAKKMINDGHSLSSEIFNCNKTQHSAMYTKTSRRRERKIDKNCFDVKID